MKKLKSDILSALAALVVLFSFFSPFLFMAVKEALADVVTPVFPVGLNNFAEGDVIEEEDWNAIEAEIGARTGNQATGTVRDTINFLLRNGLMSTSSLLIGTTATNTISSTATSTFQKGIEIAGGALSITGTATSTLANGISLSGGCISVNSVCASVFTGSGAADKVAFWTSASGLSSNTNFHFDASLIRLGIGTTSPYAKLSVAGQTVAEYFTATSSIASTFPNASSTVLSVSSSFAVTPLTSALTLAGTDGTFAEYAGTSCTNQFPRSLDALGVATCATVGAADVSLANLTATDTSLTFSGTYNGSTARTIGLNLGNANTWTALQTFSGNASTTQIGSTGSSYFATTGGNVGVGTTSPSATADVYGTFRVGVAGSVAPSKDSLLYVDPNATFGGKIGIGTTSPKYRVDIDATGVTGGGLRVFSGTPVIVLGITSTNSNARNYGFTTNYNAFGTFEIHQSAAVGTDPIGATNVFTIDQSGNVGIAATTSPYAKLSVEQGTETNSFVVSNQGSTTPSFIINGVNGNGRVGVATLSPAYTLDVAGDLRVDAASKLIIPNASANTVAVLGQLDFDTTANQLLVGTTTANTPAVFSSIGSFKFEYPTTTLAFRGSYSASGTTTIVVPGYPYPVDFYSANCRTGPTTSNGTSSIQIGDGSNFMGTVQGDNRAAGITTALTANTSFTAGESIHIRFGGLLGTVSDNVACDFAYRYTRQ